MRTIDVDRWPRRDHFRFFRTMDHPHISISAQVDITELWASRKSIPASPTISLVYALTRAANRVPELRQRIRGDKVVEHEVIHPLIPVLDPGDTFCFCLLTYSDGLDAFAARASAEVKGIQKGTSRMGSPYDEAGRMRRDDVVGITVVPWFSFTSLSLTKARDDSIPLLAYGKVVKSGEREMLPLGITFHHGLVDGLHVARFLAFVEEEASALARAGARSVQPSSEDLGNVLRAEK